MTHVLSMRGSTRCGIALVALFLLNPLGFDLARASSASIEIMFTRGTVELPTGVTACNLDQATMPIETREVFSGLGTVELARSFPTYAVNDTLRTVPSGATVRIPDFGCLFRFTLQSAAAAETALVRAAGAPNIRLLGNTSPLVENAIPRDSVWNSQQYYLDRWANYPGGALAPGSTRATEGWDIITATDNVTIAVIDGGVDYTHVDLGGARGPNAKVLPGWDYYGNDGDPQTVHNFHGTATAGIVAALTDNLFQNKRIGVAGVAGGWGYDHQSQTGSRGARIIPLRVYDDNPGDATQHLATAIAEAADPQRHNADIVYCSLSTVPGAPNVLGEQLAVLFVRQMEKLFVVGKGNFNSNGFFHPGDYDETWVLSIGANDPTTGERYVGQFGSNYGRGMDLLAPGEAVTTMPSFAVGAPAGLNYGGFAGTSAAAPYAAGAAALILAANPDMHPEDVQGLLRAGARRPGGVPGYDEQTGAGNLDIGSSLLRAQCPYEISHHTVTGGVAGPGSPEYLTMIYNAAGLVDGWYKVNRHDVRRIVALPASDQAGVTAAWGRGIGMGTGWSDVGVAGEAALFGTGFTRALPVVNDQVELQTFIYYVRNILGQYVGTFPTTAENVVFGYAVSTLPFDTTSPAGAGDVAATTTGAMSLALAWTAPGEDGTCANAGTVASYDIRYGLAPIGDDLEFYLATRYQPTVTPLPPGGLQSVTVSGLAPGTTYYFRIRAVDDRGNVGPMSNQASATTFSDAVAPSQVTNLNVVALGDPTQMRLTWTAPGDDGTTGTANAYEVRWYHQPMNAGNFSQGTLIQPAPVPVAGGQPQSTDYPRDPCTRYYVALRARDEANNWSLVSNSPTLVPHGTCGGGGGEGGDDDPPIVNGAPSLTVDGGSVVASTHGSVKFRIMNPPIGEELSVEVYSVLGRMVTRCKAQRSRGNSFEATWRLGKGSDGHATSGIYFAVVRLGTETLRTRVVVLQ